MSEKTNVLETISGLWRMYLKAGLLFGSERHHIAGESG